MMRLYLLDTSVVLALVRGKELGHRIDETYKLSSRPMRPLTCSVSQGELWALAEANAWEETRRRALAEMLESLVMVDPGNPGVVDAYVTLYMVCRRHPQGSRVNMGENDLWIAAAARAAGATLLTLDRDFAHFPAEAVEVVYIDPASKRTAR